jgi:SlyX protein
MTLDQAAQLQERLTHLTRMVEDLSDVVASQGREIDKLTCSLTLVVERMNDRGQGDGGPPLADERPPHY